MRTRSSPPLIVALSVSLYQFLLHLGPADYREKYEEATLQVFRQCCYDAYQQHGAPGVLSLWLSSFSDAVLGMLAERFSVERMPSMLPSLRRSLIITVSAFVVFGLAYLSLLRIIDPLPPFEAIGRLHPEIGLAYMLIRDSANLAFLIVVGSGLLLLGLTLKQAVVARQRDVLARFGGAGAVILAFVVGTVTLFQLPHSVIIAAWIQVVYLGFSLLCVLGTTILLAQIILRSTWGPRATRFALLCMALVTLAMGVALAATTLWIIRLWMVAPQFAASQGLDPAAVLGNFGGSLGVVLVVGAMLVTTVGGCFATWRGARARFSPSLHN